jgi:hypothetical protein
MLIIGDISRLSVQLTIGLWLLVDAYIKCEQHGSTTLFASSSKFQTCWLLYPMSLIYVLGPIHNDKHEIIVTNKM